MKRDTNVTRKTGQKQPYFTPFCTVELILKPHIEILDNLWYQTILLGYLIGLRANLIVMGNWKSLYCPSASLLSNYVNNFFLLLKTRKRKDRRAERKRERITFPTTEERREKGNNL